MLNSVTKYRTESDLSLLAASVTFESLELPLRVQEASIVSLRKWLTTNIMGPIELNALLAEGYSIRVLASEFDYDPTDSI